MTVEQTPDAITLAAFARLCDQPAGNERCACSPRKFVGWETIHALPPSLELLGIFEHALVVPLVNAYQERHPAGTNYWSETAPVAVHYYPYAGCTIHRCRRCSRIYLHYRELGGHAAQLRLRLVDPRLIDLTP